MSTIGHVERRFKRSIVRRACSAIYGSKISTVAWGNWKDWAGVDRRATDFSFDEFCMMCAIAQLRHIHPYRELLKSEIVAIARSDAMLESLGGLIAMLDNAGVCVGWDILKVLELRGVSIDASELQSKLGRITPNAWYRVDDVLAKVG